MYNVILDFDGVLANTWDAVRYGIVESGRANTLEAAADNMRKYAAKRPNHARNHTLNETELAAEYAWTSNFGKYVHQHGFQMFDGFVRELENLHTARIAIVSSGSENYVLPALSRTKLMPTHTLCFEAHHSKEEKIERICDDWSVAISDVYYVTDTLADIYELRDCISAKKLLGVSWGYCSREQIRTELPGTQILETPADLRRILEK